MTTLEGEERGQARDSRGREDPEGGVRRPLVLVVSSAPTATGASAALLWYNGYEVGHAEDMDAALSFVADHRPDLVVLDGPEAGAALDPELLRRRPGGDRAVPVIALIEPDAAAGEGEALRAGVDAVLQKPASPFEVVRTVMRLVGPPPPSGTGA